jgi:hypothetical protein
LFLLLLIKDLKPLDDVTYKDEELHFPESSSSDLANEKAPLNGATHFSTNQNHSNGGGLTIESVNENGTTRVSDLVDVTNENESFKARERNSTNGKVHLNGDGKPQVHVISDLEDLHNFISDRHS